MTVNTYKLIFALVVVIGSFASIMTNTIDQAPGWGLIGTVCGYVLGNGIVAKQGSDVPGILRPKPGNRRVDDPEEG